MRILYHVTNIDNLESISESGLIPQIGELSSILGETVERTYFFHTPDDMLNALTNWLGEEFDALDAERGEESFHVVLECRVGDDVEIDPDLYEVALDWIVPPEDIRISTNPEYQVDFTYDDDFISRFPTLESWD